MATQARTTGRRSSQAADKHKVYKALTVNTYSTVYAKMKITDYVDQQARALERSSQRIRDFRVFDFNYIPQEPLMREEVKPVIDACLRYLKTGIANHLFIVGSRGCGKNLDGQIYSSNPERTHAS